MMRPLFKWAGGKNKMKEKYQPYFWPAQDLNVFVDAFYGSGSVSHWVAEKYPNIEFVINDANTELVNLYQNLRDYPEWFIDKVSSLERDYLSIYHTDLKGRSVFYNGLRQAYVHYYKDMKDVEESALLYFMMKISFNGWWKVYNFANGRYSTCRGTLTEKDSFINRKLLAETSEFFKERVRCIMNEDFTSVMCEAHPKAYMYFDPPYRDSYGYEYQEGDDVFGDTQQLQLCEMMRECDKVGAAVSMSNKEIGDGFWQENLPEFEIFEYDAKYTAAHGPTTKDVREVLIRNFSSEVSNLERLF